MPIRFWNPRDKSWFEAQASVADTEFVLLGDSVSLNRPPQGREHQALAYWNAERQALRFKCPDPAKPWRSLAEGFVRAPNAADGDDAPLTFRIVGGYRAASYPERTVVFKDGRERELYINLPDAAGVLSWHKLAVRPEYWDPAVWQPGTYAQPAAPEGTPGTADDMRRAHEAAAAQAAAHAAQQTNTDDGKKATMADSTMETIKRVVMDESGEALWRSTAKQVTCAGRDLFLVALKKALPKQRLWITQVGKVLATPLGESAFGYALGAAMEIKAGATDLKRKRLARELRINGEAGALNVVLNPIREFLTTGIDSILNGMPELDTLMAGLPAAPAELPDRKETAEFTAKAGTRAHATTTHE